MLVESIIVSVLGFLIGGLIMTAIGAVTIKFFVRRVVREVISEETKEKAVHWLQDAFKNGIGDALKDEKIKKIIEEILETAKDKLVEEGHKDAGKSGCGKYGK